MADRPDSIALGGVTINIDWSERDEQFSTYHGAYSSERRHIKMVVGPNPVDERATLIHEIMHAVWDIGCLREGDDEERIISVLSMGMTEALVRSPKLRRYLSGES